MTRKLLSSLEPSQSGRVYSIMGDSGLKRRLIDMGIIPGTEIFVSKVAPMGDPMELRIRGYQLTLRRADAAMIALMSEEESAAYKAAHAHKAAPQSDSDDMIEHERAARLTELMMNTKSCTSRRKAGKACVIEAAEDETPFKLALIGNPNCGKTTLFNAMTGAREYVGNRPGVTVEKKEGKVKSTRRYRRACPDGLCTMGHEMTLVDLPGIYSLSPNTMEEVVSRDHLMYDKPDAIINIVDATNIERNLYLTIQLLELEIPMIIALNMMDEVEKRGDKIDVKRLSKELGIPIVPISAKTGMGIYELIDSAQKLLQAIHTQIHEGFKIEPDDLYDEYTHSFHHKIGDIIKPYAQAADMFQHWAEIKLLEGDPLVREALKLPDDVYRKVDEVVAEYASASEFNDSELMVAESRYRYIEHAVSIAVVKKYKRDEITVNDKIDRVLTNRIFAIPIFIGIMAVIFMLTFGTLGAWLSDLVGAFIDETLMPFAENLLVGVNAAPWVTSLVTNGIISGVGGVLTFLPQIALLFFFLSLLEDSGYMSRIAFIMDRPMRRFGLSGKSFIPLLMGFGCTVPATMGARTMGTMNDKRMTILLLPFMSCSAKLPVYALITSAFFGRSGGMIIICLYILGIVVGMLSGLLFKASVFKDVDAEYLIELPPYRLPNAKNTLLNVWEKVKHFLEKAGTIIFAMSVVIWFLMSLSPEFKLVENEAESIIGRFGTLIAPIFKPLGFGTWQAVVALISGIIAKEAVVSSLAVFFGFSASASGGAVFSAMSSAFTPLSAFSFLVFVLLYTPCIAAVATMKNELGSTKWTAAMVGYQIGIAYLVSLIVYQVGSLIL